MYELKLFGGIVYDGLGSPGVRADVAITGDRVRAVGRDLGPARREIDVAGMAVTPGFIDPHSHSDMVPMMSDPQPFKLLQGVTTEIAGNCGYSAAPMDEAAAKEAQALFGDLAAGAAYTARSFGTYLDDIEAAGPTNHLAVMVGHHTLRLTANGMRRTLAPKALAAMCTLAGEAFAAGAVGFSSGLIYTPGAYADVEELVALGMVAHRWQRPYATHMRDESDALEAALDEAIEIGRRARIPVQISHCKAAGRPNHGKSSMLLGKLHAARVAGVDVRGDVYPYLAGGTMLHALLPPQALVGGAKALLARMADAAERCRLRARAEDPAQAMAAGLWRQVTPADVLINRHRDTAVVGRTLKDVSGEGDAWEVLCALITADVNAMIVPTMMAESDMRAMMADPLIGIGSDNGMPTGLDHPRTWGCFPHFLGRYVREEHVVDWPEAVRKATSASAAQFGLAARGWVGPGAIADLCVIDVEKVGHDGTYTVPDVKPTGILFVVLAGDVVVDWGEFTGERRGRVLRAGHAERAARAAVEG
ncbi:N-acyl-D-amino-acid deacylase family protein [Streptomyces sp. CA-106110]|uniref:N-acyl-D-amino-acid deacylase family protein n=1 Tax=Streptomyces sp. CA-106110 TaxID=3240044 RepID=UPI003D8A5193